MASEIIPCVHCVCTKRRLHSMEPLVPTPSLPTSIHKVVSEASQTPSLRPPNLEPEPIQVVHHLRSPIHSRSITLGPANPQAHEPLVVALPLPAHGPQDV